MVKQLKGTKCSWTVLTVFVGLLLIWFSNGGKRDPELTEKKDEVVVRDSEHGPEKHETHSNGLLPAIEGDPGARSSIGAIEEFEEWMGRFLPSDSSGRDRLIEEGVAVAGRRREKMKRLMQADPEAALALAVPYEFRRELPPEIIDRLETPVSNFAQYQVVVYCSDPGHAGHDHAESEYERIAKFGGNRYRVHTFGSRFNVTTKDLISIHGIAIDEDLAMADDPVRVLSESERADRGFEANIAVSVGGNVYGASDEEAVRQLRQILEEDECSLGPQPAAGYRALQREEVEGVSLLLAQEPDEDIDFTDLSEAQSAPHTLGPKTMLYIRVRFSDQEEDFEPIDLATLKERQVGVEAFWYENSYGKSSLTTTFTDTMTLPNPISYYGNSHTFLDTLFEDALPLAKATGQAKGQNWDEATYDFCTVLTSGGNWTHGGLATVGGRYSHLSRAVASKIQTASHEFGHNLGLYHANFWRTDSTSPIGRDSIPGGYVGDKEGDEWSEYGNLFSPMGNLTPWEWSNSELEKAHYTTGEKVHLDWLIAEDGDWESVDQTTTTPIRLYRHDVKSDDFGAMLNGVARAIKINADSGDYAATDKRRYWLSYRRLPTNDVLVLEDSLPYGLQVEWQRETYSRDGSILLDMTPYTIGSANNYIADSIHPTRLGKEDEKDGVLVIGRTYSDKVADIHFTPIAQGGENPNEWIDVMVNIGAQDGNTDPEITSFTASSTQVAPGEMVNFSVEAEDKDGDTLYHTWTFGDNSMVVESLNSKTARKSWNSRGIYRVRITVSDGKGGSDSKEIHVAVGPVSDFIAIRGRVTSENFPVEGAIVKLYSEWEMRRTSLTTVDYGWTDGDGNYLLLHAKDTENWLTILKDGFGFRPLFPNPVYLADSEVNGRDWVGFPLIPDRTPVLNLTTPKDFVAMVPEGSGLFLEVDISEGNFLSSSGKPTVSWSVSEAPEGGEVTFSPPQGLATVANFNVPGSYAILISVTYDGVNTETAEVFVRTGLNPDDNPPSADAEVYLSMDEGEGITATDSRGENNNGSLVNGASWTGPSGGISGTGIVLDGIDDQIHMENANGIHDLFDLIHGERTITLWFKADDPLRKTKQALYQEGDQSRGLNIYLEAGTLYIGGWINGDNGLQETFLRTELLDTNWHYVALVQHPDRNQAFHIFSSQAFRGFLDGMELGAGDRNTFVVRSNVVTDRKITLGASRVTTRYHDGISFSPDYHFRGIVDEFHLWNRALSRFELAQQLFGQTIMGPELILSSVDHSNGSVVIPPGMGIILNGETPGSSSQESKWETVMAPEGGEATFSDSTHPSATATFSTPGYYKLRLSADDGMQKSAIDIDVHAGLEAGSNFYSPKEVVYYSMDEASGEIVGNSAEESEPGILSNPSSWTSEGGGISGTAIQFDGIDDGLEMGNHSPFTKSSNTKSFALWVKPNELGTGNKEVILLEAGRSSGLNIYLDGNVLYFGGWNDTEIRWETYLPVHITWGRWSHLALVFDPDHSGLPHDGLRAYLNGRQVASGLACFRN